MASRKSGRGGWRTEEGWETGQMCILAKRRRAPPPAQRRPALQLLTPEPPRKPQNDPLSQLTDGQVAA